MDAFNTKTISYGNPALISTFADRICHEIISVDDYQVNCDVLLSEGIDMSVTKGGFFKNIPGMQTGLTTSVMSQANSSYCQAGVGIFRQQAIPTIISTILFWPALINQIRELVKQSNRGDKFLDAVQAVISENGGSSYSATTAPASYNSKFCTKCSDALAAVASFCSNSGAL